MRSAILTIIACTIAIASGIMLVPVPAAEDLPRVSSAAPVKVPYLDFDLEQLSIIRDYQEAHEEHAEPQETDEPEEIPMEEETADTEEINEPEEWIYYGNCRITHYDDCAECCGVAGNATASGVYPTPRHTVATGDDLPFGTLLLINDQVYVVEDRGVDAYQVDIFVEDHETALQLGEYYTDVYMRFPE